MIATVAFKIKNLSTMLTSKRLVFYSFVIHTVEPFKIFMFLFMLYHLKWLPIVDSNHASRINSPLPSPRLLMGNVSTTKFGGPYRGRTGDYALQGHCVPNYTNSPNYTWRPARESNPGPQFWRLICYRNTCETF